MSPVPQPPIAPQPTPGPAPVPGPGATNPTPPPPTPPVAPTPDPSTFEAGGQVGKFDYVSIGFLLLGVSVLIVIGVVTVQRAKQSKKLASTQADIEGRVINIESIMKQNKLMAG